MQRVRNWPGFILLSCLGTRAVASETPFKDRESILIVKVMLYYFLNTYIRANKILPPISEVSSSIPYFTSIPHKVIHVLRTIF